MSLVKNFAEKGTVAKMPFYRNFYVRKKEMIANIAAAIQNNSRLTIFANKNSQRFRSISLQNSNGIQIDYSILTGLFGILPEHSLNGRKRPKHFNVSFYV